MAAEVERDAGEVEPGEPGDGGQAGGREQPADSRSTGRKTPRSLIPASWLPTRKPRPSTPDLERKEALLKARSKSSDRLRAINLQADEAAALLDELKV